jgi:hypothetical protein
MLLTDLYTMQRHMMHRTISCSILHNLNQVVPRHPGQRSHRLICPVIVALISFTNSILLPHLHLALSNLFLHHRRTRHFNLLDQTLRRRIRPHNLALNLAYTKLRLQNAHHAQQPPRRITRLRAHTHPVACPRNVEPDVFPWAAVRVARSWGLGLWIVGAEDFEGARVTCCSGRVLEKLKEVELGFHRGIVRAQRVDLRTSARE